MKLGETVGTGDYSGDTVVYVENGEVLTLRVPNFFTESEKADLVESAKKIYLRAAKRVNKAHQYANPSS